MQPVYDLLALAIFAMMVVLLFRSFKPAKDQTRDLEDWMAEQLTSRPMPLSGCCRPARTL